MGKSETVWKRLQEPPKKKLSNWHWLPPRSSLTSKAGKFAKWLLYLSASWILSVD